MAQDQNHLIWLDMEMTGLNPDSDRIIEMAMVVTNSKLEVIAEGPVIAVHQPDAVLEGMDEWNKNTHGRSGLIERVKASTIDEAAAEALYLDFIGQDRRFMARYMPKLEDWFHYRNLDVSTLKELCRRWRPDVYKGIEKKGAHQALADIHESIAELRYYREHFLKV